MSQTDLEQSAQEVYQVFPSDRPEGKVCAYIFRRLEELGSDFESVTLADISSELRCEDPTVIVRALDYLALSDVHLLERRFDLYDDSTLDEVLECPSETFSDNDIQRALRDGVLLDKNGGRIEDFVERVFVRYVLSNKAKSLLPRE